MTRTREQVPPGVLVDTNVLLDVVLKREPHARDAALLLDAIARGRARGYVAGHAVTAVHYVVGKARNGAVAATAASDILELLEAVELGTAEFQRALALGLVDFEDAVQVAACLRADADFLVTRDARDFKGAPVRIRTAGEVLAFLGAAS